MFWARRITDLNRQLFQYNNNYNHHVYLNITVSIHDFLHLFVLLLRNNINFLSRKSLNFDNWSMHCDRNEIRLVGETSH